MRILIENFDQFFDRATRTEFNPVQDLRTGCHVGIADVDEATGADLLSRPGGKFRHVPDAEYLAMTTVKRPAPLPESRTGDPLAETGKGAMEGAPAPPTARARTKKTAGEEPAA